jgi:hypothetical protein
MAILLHESAETLHSYLEKQNLYTTLQAQVLYRRGIRRERGKAGPIATISVF